MATDRMKTMEYRPERDGDPRYRTMDYRPQRDGVPQLTEFGTQQQPQSVWTREWLKKKGYQDSEIGFDVPSQTVLVRDQPFAKVTQNVDGKSYASLQDLEGSYNRLNPLTQGPGNRQQRYSDTADSTLSDALNQLKQPFQFNPETDPRYKASVQLAQQNAQKASKAAAEQYNSLGILNSTVTGDRLGQIQQSAMGDISARLVPELYNSALQERNQNIAQLSQLANMLQGTANNERDFNRGALESDRNFGLQESNVTGKYLPSEAKSLLDELMQLKDTNRYGTVPGAGERADAIRQLLPRFGINPADFGADRTLQQAAEAYSRVASPTMAARQFAEGQRQFDTQTRLTEKEIESKAQQFAQQMGLNWAQLNQDQQQFLRTAAIQEGNLAVNQRQMDLAETESAYKRSTTGKEIDAKLSAGNYADILGNLGNAKSYQEARAYVDANADMLNEADYRRAMEYIRDSFPQQ